MSDEATTQPTNIAVILRKCAVRVIPFLFILYIFNYLDRVNVGYAKLTMQKDLNLSEDMYAMGAGLFFIGYFLFEIPSNLILEKVGARRWIARIMISWGIVSCCMMFTKGEYSFYALRVLLGLAEAGFFPGMILYLTYWFPAAERAKAISRFMTATPLAGAFGGPLSGAILQWTGGIGGLRDWQWLFLIEGIPSFILGFVVLFWLPNGPKEARFLSDGEKSTLLAYLDKEETQKSSRHLPWSKAFSNPQVIQLTAFYFTLQIAIYGVIFYLPQIVKNFKYNNFQTGLITAIPYTCAAIAMVCAGMVADRTGKRKEVVGVSAFWAAIGLVIAGQGVGLHNPYIGIAGLCVAATGLWSTLGPFWSLPTAILGGSAAAAGIAFINSIGNLGGFVGPKVMSYLKNANPFEGAGLTALAIAMVFAGLLAVTLKSASKPTQIT